MEIWRDIKGFEGAYQVSSYGRIKSLARKCGNYYKGEKMLSLSLTKDGYMKARLIFNGKDRTVRVHRIVAETFLKNPFNKPTVNHIDGNKENNKVNNLEYSTMKEQVEHSYSLGLKRAVRTNRKLTKEDVEFIRSNYKKHSTEYGSVALASKFNVTHRVILQVIRGESYKDY